jgi:MoaA/NifB/PqqE/SkfB family radical SAM enzyme
MPQKFKRSKNMNSELEEKIDQRGVMRLKPELSAYVDDEGRLVLPPEVASRFGLKPGTQVLVDEAGNNLRLLKPVTHLSKVYIEPTNRCNLECRTCIRNVWDEPLGEMSNATFARIVEGLRSFSPPPTVMFGGLGEPLFHPDIVEMVAQVKSVGATAEMITNGTLLTKERSRQLIDADLDMLWVSLDGATPESYADVRLGAALPEVLANLIGFREARWATHFSSYFVDYHLKPQLGIVFVAMKRNITDLPAVLRLGNRLGTHRFLVTNVLPYTAEMYDEILYSRALNDVIYMLSPWGNSLELPKIDINAMTHEVLYQIMLSDHPLSFAGANLGERNDRCPFIEKGAVAIRWDGDVSPCLPLLHDHKYFMNGYERSLRRYAVGNVAMRDLHGLWTLAEYQSFRERVQKFDFSPCILCGGCDLFELNEEDCFGSPFPTCGGCLWAQGIIQCP